MTYEFEGKTEREAIDNASAELGLEKDQFDVEIIEVQKNSLFKKGFVRIRVYTDDAAKNENEAGDEDFAAAPEKEAAPQAKKRFEDPAPK